MPANLPVRKHCRLKEYDYSQNGKYFITICSFKRKNIFSDIVGAIHESPEVKLKPCGKIADNVIKQLEDRFQIVVDNYVIMPNHIHLIISIENQGIMRAIPESPLQGRSLISKIVGYLKMNVSKEIHKIQSDENIWQRSFYDHIIRNEQDFKKYWDYTLKNPYTWKSDKLYIDK